MARGGFEPLLEALFQQPEGRLPDRLCGAAAALLACEGVALTLPGDGILTVSGTFGVGAAGERLQRELGEGPTWDALSTGDSVEAELPASARWPVFGPGAHSEGIGLVHALPVLQGGVRLGALTAYRRRPLPLDDGELRESLIVARLSGELVVAMQADVPESELHGQLLREPASDWAVHQAAGMVSVQLRVPVAEALARLRGHAFASERSLDDVAEDVLGRRLVLERDR